MTSRYYPQIWHTVLQIPCGKVASYGQIADLAGLPGRARLVGKALGATSAELAVPWYRVVRSDLRLAFLPGSAEAIAQQQHLAAEGVLVKGLRVDKQAHWQPQLHELLAQLHY